MMASRQQLARTASHEAPPGARGQRPARWPAWLSIIALGLVAAGCGEGAHRPPVKEGFTARLELDDRSSSLITVTSVMALQGTYGPGCLGRIETSGWTIPLNGYALLPGETALTVEGGDVACTLLVTGVKAGPVGALSSYTCAAPFSLATAYAQHGVAFLLNGAGETKFYANFRAEPNLTFLANFLVRMAYSDDVSKTDANYDTQYDISSSTAEFGLVPAPTATISLAPLDVRVTAVNVVKSAVGNVLLTQGNVLGQSYAIDLGTLGASPTYGSVDAVFTNTLTTKVVLIGDTRAILAAEFGLMSIDLTTPRERSIIVANTESGVASYQVFRISFRRPIMDAGPTAISLGAAGDFAVFAAAGVGLGAGATVGGDVGVDAGLAALTGFTLVADPGGTFSTSTGVITGSIYSTDHSDPTPGMLSTAAAAMTAAHDDGMARLLPTGTDMGAGELGGLVLPPGLYHWNSAATITTDLTLTGGAGDVWILRVGGGLDVAAGAHVHLAGEALAKNVYWITVGAVTLGADAVVEGQVLSGAAITTGVSAVVNGRALSATAVTLGASSQVNVTAL
jgi:hypothetical protein